ncbi:unnamed protein product [Brugia timori]|uniref:LIM zinc-binding domain-containing protein n=1 Tax=Brugia timori TaxID=42155 RepID=A0A0R3QVN7_9BILA|nr:unnamed protein product [Brugia timori]
MYEGTRKCMKCLICTRCLWAKIIKNSAMHPTMQDGCSFHCSLLLSSSCHSLSEDFHCLLVFTLTVKTNYRY